MNVDHFYWIDVTDAIQTSSSSSTSSPSSLLSSLVGRLLPFTREGDMPVNARKKDSLLQDLASDYGALSKLAKLNLGAFAPIVNVAPSVVTVGYPAVRVFTYNVSGLSEEDGKPKHSGNGAQRLLGDDNVDMTDDEGGEDITRYKEASFYSGVICSRSIIAQSTC
jgi:hypothetical protein